MVYTKYQNALERNMEGAAILIQTLSKQDVELQREVTLKELTTFVRDRFTVNLIKLGQIYSLQ